MTRPAGDERKKEEERNDFRKNETTIKTLAGDERREALGTIQEGE